MSDQPTSETLRLVEGRESNRCIVCDRYLRAGNWLFCFNVCSTGSAVFFRSVG